MNTALWETLCTAAGCTICTEKKKKKKRMAFEGGQAIKFLLGEMFTEINLVLSTVGYYHNTYSN